MSTTSPYNPDSVVFVFNGIEVRGFMDGTFIAAARDEDIATGSAGANGDVVLVRNNNRMGTVTATTMQTAPVNDLLTAQAKLYELTGGGVGELFIKDLLGTTLVHAEHAWIKKYADVEYSTDATGREWTFGCGQLELNVGSAVGF